MQSNCGGTFLLLSPLERRNPKMLLLWPALRPARTGSTSHKTKPQLTHGLHTFFLPLESRLLLCYFIFVSLGILFSCNVVLLIRQLGEGSGKKEYNIYSEMTYNKYSHFFHLLSKTIRTVTVYQIH